MPYSSVLTCAATAAAGANPTYSIDCGNGTSISGRTGTCTYSAFGSNIASCSVNGEAASVIPASCKVSISASSGGGGGGSICERLLFSPVSSINGTYSLAMTCTATASAGINPPFSIDCGNGTTITGPTGICSYSTSTANNTIAVCYVNGSTQ